MIPVVVTITTAYVIKLCREWEIITERAKIYTIICLIICPCELLDFQNNTCNYLILFNLF